MSSKEITSLQSFLSILNDYGIGNKTVQIDNKCKRALQIHISNLLEMKRTLDLPPTLYPDEMENSPSIQYYFRGHENKSYRLKSSVKRHSGICENELFKFFEMHAPEDVSNMSNLDKLAIMQHFGCYTRLLDITDNPLVALYFACTSSKNTDGPNNNLFDGEVIVFSPIISTILDYNDKIVQFLACLPALDFEDKNKLVKLIFCEIRKGNGSKLGNFENLSKKEIKSILAKINFSIDETFDFREVLFPRTVRARTFFPRIRNQKGLFIIDPLKCVEKEEQLIVAERLIVPSNCKENIRVELDCVGINEYTLFQDLEHFSKYANWKNSQLKSGTENENNS